MNEDIWEIRKDGKTIVLSTVKNCGYPLAKLREMERKGELLYRNKQRVELDSK